MCTATVDLELPGQRTLREEAPQKQNSFLAAGPPVRTQMKVRSQSKNPQHPSGTLGPFDLSGWYQKLFPTPTGPTAIQLT